MEWIIIGVFAIVIIVLIIKLGKKQEIDKAELNKYQEELVTARANLSTINYNCEQISERTREAERKYYSIIEEYKKATTQNQEELDNYFARQKEFRQSELDTEFERQERERQESLDARMRVFTEQAQERINKAEENANAEIEKFKQAQQDIANVTLHQEERYEALLAPLQQYEKEKQEKLFYTIQVPDEYKQDIDFLLTTVSQKVQHPDIINKLVWAEYVKPYIDETFKRVGITDEPGIYKLTNLDSGKAYIGKSTNIKKRIADHFKSSIGIKTIADQAVHHAILETGFWNWSIEYIIYCDKDELNDLEKYYIDFFKTQDFGYNKNAGGGG